MPDNLDSHTETSDTMRPSTIRSIIAALLLLSTACAAPIDPSTTTATIHDEALVEPGLEVPQLPELPSPCEDDETPVYVDEGQCLKVTGYHSSPHHGRWWGGCSTHKWNGLCDQQLVICVGAGAVVDQLGDSCEPCDPDSIGAWGEL